MRNFILLASFLALTLAGCTDSGSSGASPNALTPPPSFDANAALLDPAQANAKAPSSFKVRFETSKGEFVVEVTRAWAPQGADRFYNLVLAGFFEEARFFRVIKGFMVQFGINGDPAISKVWKDAKIVDDPVTQSNARGKITFATAGPHTRTTQVFINYANNSGSLDAQGFAPFGQVVEGMEVVDSLYGDYGEGAPRGNGPAQQLLQDEGNHYLKTKFPLLDYIEEAVILEE